MGVLAFAVVLRAHGVAVTYLGGDLPLEAWIGAVGLVRPEAVVLAVPSLEDLPAVREAVEARRWRSRIGSATPRRGPDEVSSRRPPQDAQRRRRSPGRSRRRRRP